MPYWLSPGSKLTIIANSAEGMFADTGLSINIENDSRNRFLAQIVFIVTNAYIGRVVSDWAVDPRALFEYHLEGSNSFKLDLSFCDKVNQGIAVNMTQGKIDSGNQSGKRFGSIGKLVWRGFRNIYLTPAAGVSVLREVIYTAKNCEMSHDLSDGNN
ncbi:MAG: hypothetical protein RSE01_08770 [Akkermansia sp.]